MCETMLDSYYTCCVFVDTRGGGLELSGDEILADGIIFRDKKSPKDRLEVAIGDGMEFTIHGKNNGLF